MLDNLQRLLSPIWNLLRFLVVDIWPITLVMLLGAAAVYLLLPRPRGFLKGQLLWGILAAGLALVLGGVLLTRGGLLTPETFLFYTFSGIALAAGGLLVTQHNPARAALSFALVILSTCGLFLLLAAPFLMAATIIIYAGAIIVTFLFVLMLAQQSGLGDADLRSREPLLATLTGFVLLGALLYVLRQGYDTRDLDAWLDEVRQARNSDDQQALAASLEKLKQRFEKELAKKYDLDDLEIRSTNTITASVASSVEDLRDALKKLYDLGQEGRSRVGLVPARAANPAPVSTFSGPSPTLLAKPDSPSNQREVRRGADGLPVVPADNSAYLGRSLFTDYLLPVELGGLLLLVATVGAIAITQRAKPEKAA